MPGSWSIIWHALRLYWISQAEDFCNDIESRTRRFLPPVARLCLTATFFEDGLRLWLQWHEQCAQLQLLLNCSADLPLVIVFTILVGQIVGCALVLLRRYVNVAIALLACILLLQWQIYALAWHMQQLLRNLALLGGLLLLHVEARQVRTVYGTGGGLPLLIRTRPQEYIQLMGRILLAVMYLTLLRFELTFLLLVQNALGLLLMGLIVLGHRTRCAALSLAFVLSVWNVYAHAWWFAVDAESDILKYKCFHTLSVIGGLLMLVVLGPGCVSLEHYKKRW